PGAPPTGPARDRPSPPRRRTIALGSPRRGGVPATLTSVTPAAGTDAPPGTVSRNENAPAVPTHVSTSHTPTDRPNSVSERHSSRSSSASGTPLKARTRVPYHRSHSSRRSTRGALTVPAVLVRSLAIRHAYQCDPGGARQFFPGGHATASGEVHCEVGPRYEGQPGPPVPSGRSDG